MFSRSCCTTLLAARWRTAFFLFFLQRAISSIHSLQLCPCQLSNKQVQFSEWVVSNTHARTHQQKKPLPKFTSVVNLFVFPDLPLRGDTVTPLLPVTNGDRPPTLLEKKKKRENIIAQKTTWHANIHWLTQLLLLCPSNSRICVVLQYCSYRSGRKKNHCTKISREIIHSSDDKMQSSR